MKGWYRPVTEEESATILRLHHAEGWPVGTISAELGRHHDTVEGVLAHAGVGVQKVSTRARLVDPFLPFMKETLAKYPRLRASRLWSMVKARGYTGSKSGFRAIVSRLRPRPHAEAYLRRSVLPGQEAQVDWAHFGKIAVGRALRDLWLLVIVLSYSRLRFMRFSLRAAMPSFLSGHVEAFRFFGAVPRTILYDNLKSAVLEREGDAVRFHPTMLALAGHYRFEPRACAPYRPNEKGRVERAIRDVRESFFAARQYRSVEDLNEQARAWCLEIARERRVPDARELTVEEAFLEERPKMVELVDDDFPVEERVEVRVGKTPYVRFDKNDYSVPHTHVQRRMTVIATDNRVRVVDPSDPTQQVLADHARSFDRDQRIEEPSHLRALVAQKRRAHQSRGFDRLFSVVPSSRVMMEKIAERGGNLGATTQGLLQLLERVGAELLERAVAESVAHEQPHLRAVHHALDRLRHEAGQPPPLSVPVTTDARAAVQVRPHALSTYDRLHAPGEPEGGAHDDDPF
ncbi:IS21 family transposase [Sorangium sp. So ce854]|uniref:IS21 family transposase n=1 Tax=Sorangium sp. So ce854 TaxID=3133322 RepID=UPI003F600F9C